MKNSQGEAFGSFWKNSQDKALRDYPRECKSVCIRSNFLEVVKTAQKTLDVMHLLPAGLLLPLLLKFYFFLKFYLGEVRFCRRPLGGSPKKRLPQHTKF